MWYKLQQKLKQLDEEHPDGKFTIKMDDMSIYGRLFHGETPLTNWITETDLMKIVNAFWIYFHEQRMSKMVEERYRTLKVPS